MQILKWGRKIAIKLKSSKADVYPSFQLTVLPENMSKFQMKPLASSRINLPHDSFIVEVCISFAPAQVSSIWLKIR